MEGVSSAEYKEIDEIEPIIHGIVAESHTPIYKMHRYFARRPWNVFNYLIQHYSNPGDIILDPFCGGGVTVVEALKLHRKIIGVDLNPMATFITEREVVKFDGKEFSKALNQIEKEIKEKISQLYNTKCTKCGNISPAEWFEWSFIAQCPDCNGENIIVKTKKVGGGKYECNNCKSTIVMSKLDRSGETIVSIKLRCKYCKAAYEKEPDNNDLALLKQIESEFDNIIKTEELSYPKFDT